MNEIDNILIKWSQDTHTLALARRHSNGNTHTAEDAISDVIVAALRSMPNDHPEPNAWLNLSLKRACWNIYRSNKAHDRRSQVKSRDLTTGPEYIDADLTLLKEHEMKVCVLIAAGYEQQEAARFLGLTIRQADRYMKRARERLRGERKTREKTARELANATS